MKKFLQASLDASNKSADAKASDPKDFMKAASRNLDASGAHIKASNEGQRVLDEKGDVLSDEQKKRINKTRKSHLLRSFFHSRLSLANADALKNPQKNADEAEEANREYRDE